MREPLKPKIVPKASSAKKQEKRPSLYLTSYWSPGRFRSTPRWAQVMMRLQPLTNPFDRNAIPPETKEIIRKTLESSRELSKVFPEHLTFRQAIRNICMAYSLVEAPTPEELRLFFPSIRFRLISR
jgi:hypothetical protein